MQNLLIFGNWHLMLCNKFSTEFVNICYNVTANMTLHLVHKFTYVNA